MNTPAKVPRNAPTAPDGAARKGSTAKTHHTPKAATAPETAAVRTWLAKPPRDGSAELDGATGPFAGVGVWLIFAVLPFLRAGSGATGAFLATFVAVMVFRRRR